MSSEPSAVVRLTQAVAKRPSGRSLRWLSAATGAGAAVLVWVGLFAGDSLSEQRARVANAEPAMRQRINENAKVFEALSDDQRDRVRSVAAYVGQQTGSDKAIADTAIENFDRWVRSLSMSEQDMIITAATTDERKSAVLAALDRLEAEAADTEDLGSLTRRSHRPRFSPEQSAEIASILESAAGLESREDLMPIERLTLALASLIDEDTSMPTFFFSLNQFFSRPDVADPIIDLVPTMKEQVERFKNPRARTFAAMRAVFECVESERKRTIETLKVSDERLESFLQELPPLEQDELLGLSASEFRDQITLRYVIHTRLGEETGVSPEVIQTLGEMSSRIRRNRFELFFKDRGQPPPWNDGRRPPGGGPDRDDRDRRGDGRGMGGRRPGEGFGPGGFGGGGRRPGGDRNGGDRGERRGDADGPR